MDPSKSTAVKAALCRFHKGMVSENQARSHHVWERHFGPTFHVHAEASVAEREPR